MDTLDLLDVAAPLLTLPYPFFMTHTVIFTNIFFISLSNSNKTLSTIQQAHACPQFSFFHQSNQPKTSTRSPAELIDLLVLDRSLFLKTPYISTSQPISYTTIPNDTLFHTPRNPKTAKAENRSSLKKKSASIKMCLPPFFSATTI